MVFELSITWDQPTWPWIPNTRGHLMSRRSSRPFLSTRVSTQTDQLIHTAITWKDNTSMTFQVRQEWSGGWGGDQDHCQEQNAGGIGYQIRGFWWCCLRWAQCAYNWAKGSKILRANCTWTDLFLLLMLCKLYIEQRGDLELSILWHHLLIVSL